MAILLAKTEAGLVLHFYHAQLLSHDLLNDTVNSSNISVVRRLNFLYILEHKFADVDEKSMGSYLQIHLKNQGYYSTELV
ncbi:hypothetical protein ACTXT7_006047 [Hymenolepis weldensis]